MPFVRIDISQAAPSDVVRTVSDVVYDAMRSVANVPEHDKFQVITRHSAEELVFPAEGYLGIDYTPGIVFIQVTWNKGRTIEIKQAFYQAVAEGIHAKTGIRKQDVFISLVDVDKENWSFGNGDMQYGPK